MLLLTIFVSIWLISLLVYFPNDKFITETAVTLPNGSRTTYRWNEKRHQDLEIYEGPDESPIMVQYARADDGFTGSLTISCTSNGRPVSETVDVVPGLESRVKADVIARICSG